ncbi:MAG: autotransporter domain-containing protein [Pseudomonadota bacterium]
MTFRPSPAVSLLASASCLALTIACSAPVLAANYSATDDPSLRNAITSANGAADPSSTVTLSNDVTLTSGLPVPTKSITIDTGSHVLTKTYNNGFTGSGAVTLTGPYATGAFTFKGAVLGGTAGSAAAGNGDIGMYVSNTSAAINQGTITGGAGGGLGGTGGGGVVLINTSTLTNNGTIKGGSAAAGSGGTGAFVQRGSTLTNNGTVQGGDGQTFGGSGVDFGPPVGGAASLINNGTVRGGNSATGIGGVGVFFRNGAAPIVNNGTIEGGNGAAAIRDNSAPLLTVINSGTLKAGAGYDNAIQMIVATQAVTLELHKGSVIQGNVAANSGVTNTLILGGDDNASFDVSKVGPQYQNFNTFQKTGNSVWTLTGTGSVATPWAISQSTLQIGDGASLIGDIADNAILAFNNSNALTFANVITGTGGVNQTGSGRTNLTGASTYSGPTNISGGTLAVNGSITSAVTVASGGTLGGNGTVGATTVQSGGTIAPGNSIGTLHVNGPFVQNAGSIYQVEVDPNSNASDLVLVNGTATIANGATLNVTKNPAGDYHTGAHYTVLTASGGVTGSYNISGATAISQYLALQQQQDANNIYLNVVQTGDPTTAAQTPNQQGTAGGLPGGGTIGTGLLNSPSATDARDAFDKLSGEALASARGALVSGSLLVRDTALDRLRDVCSAEDIANHPGCLNRDRPLVWAQGFGNWGHIGGNANAASLSHTTGGFLIGTDVPVYDWRIGFFGGYSRTDFHVDARSSSGVSDNYHLGAYGGTNWDDVAIRLGASYSWNDLSTERQVAFGNFSNDLHASYNAGTAQIFGEVGEAFAFDRLTVEPFANLSYVNLRTYAFREGGGDAALSSAANTQEDTFATIGLRPSTDFTVLSLPLRLKGMFGWRHTFGTVTPNATVAFAGGDAFTVTGAPIARDAGVVEAGLSTNITEAAAIALTYGAQFGGRESNNGVRGTLAVAF